ASTISWPRSPRTRMRPIGPWSPMPVTSRPRARFEGGQSARSWRRAPPLWATRLPRGRPPAGPPPAGAAPAAAPPPPVRPPGADPPHVVAQRVAEPPRLDELPLEVDHHERGGPRLELEGVGLGAHRTHRRPAYHGVGGPSSARPGIVPGAVLDSTSIDPSDER